MWFGPGMGLLNQEPSASPHQDMQPNPSAPKTNERVDYACISPGFTYHLGLCPSAGTSLDHGRTRLSIP